jgi:hypothetical protein
VSRSYVTTTGSGTDTGRTSVQEVVLFLVAEQSQTAVLFGSAVGTPASDRVVGRAGADVGGTGVGGRVDRATNASRHHGRILFLMRAGCAACARRNGGKLFNTKTQSGKLVFDGCLAASDANEYSLMDFGNTHDFRNSCARTHESDEL